MSVKPSDRTRDVVIYSIETGAEVGEMTITQRAVIEQGRKVRWRDPEEAAANQWTKYTPAILPLGTSRARAAELTSAKLFVALGAGTVPLRDVPKMMASHKRRRSAGWAGWLGLIVLLLAVGWGSYVATPWLVDWIEWADEAPATVQVQPVQMIDLPVRAIPTVPLVPTQTPVPTETPFVFSQTSWIDAQATTVTYPAAQPAAKVVISQPTLVIIAAGSRAISGSGCRWPRIQAGWSPCRRWRPRPS